MRRHTPGEERALRFAPLVVGLVLVVVLVVTAASAAGGYLGRVRFDPPASEAHP